MHLQWTPLPLNAFCNPAVKRGCPPEPPEVALYQLMIFGLLSVLFWFVLMVNTWSYELKHNTSPPGLTITNSSVLLSVPDIFSFLFRARSLFALPLQSFASPSFCRAVIFFFSPCSHSSKHSPVQQCWWTSALRKLLLSFLCNISLLFLLTLKVWLISQGQYLHGPSTT